MLWNDLFTKWFSTTVGICKWSNQFLRLLLLLLMYLKDNSSACILASWKTINSPIKKVMFMDVFSAARITPPQAKSS